MGRTKFDRPKYPQIDDLRAAILERKFVARLTWDDLADVANISPASMRRLAVDKAPDEWPKDVRNAICRYLQISVRTNVTGSDADGHVR